MNESFRPPTAARRRIAARREAVRTLMDEGHSARKIAEILGVDEGTVRNDLKAENSALDRKTSRQIKPKPAQPRNIPRCVKRWKKISGAWSRWRRCSTPRWLLSAPRRMRARRYN
jgi:transposase